MSLSAHHDGDDRTLEYIITHVFFPLQLPDGDDHSISNDHALAGVIASTAHLYLDHLDQAEVPKWHSITGLLDDLHATVEFKSLDRSRATSQLSSMSVGGVRAFLIRAQNAAIVFRKQQDVTIFESFEISPEAQDVMASQGKLICSYPGPAIVIPAPIFGDEGFLSELVNFLVRMNDDILDAAPTSQKAQSTVLETRGTTHPRYITELLTGILRSVGHPADVSRISKRIGDDVVCNNSELPWRRSSLWLLIRVALQTSLEQSTLGRRAYKTFMLFFMCCLAKDKMCADLPNDLLQAMSAKISRRLRKLGSFAPDWLSRTTLQTCTSIRSILEKRWREVQDPQHVSSSWDPSQLDLAKDIQLSLLNSRDYLSKSLANEDTNSSKTDFNPRHRSRGALDDFLSSDGAFFKEAYHTEPHVALYDVECAVAQGIDAWVGRVVNNDKACEKLEILAHNYSSSALETYKNNPELLSIMLLTTIELWVALDKLAVKEIPMLADYSPEVPTSLLHDLLLCSKGSLHRLRHAYQYLSQRHSCSNGGWSVFSPNVSANSFAVRFYGTSSKLQRLKTRIEDVARKEVREKVVELEKANARHAELRKMAANADHEFAVDHNGDTYHVGHCSKCSYERQARRIKIEVHEWPLPTQRLHASEVVMFELDCPVSFNMWRSATFQLLVDLCTPSVEKKEPYIQLTKYTALHPYFKQHPRSRITLASDTKPFVSTHYNPTSVPSTQEQVCVNNGLKLYGFDSHACVPVSEVLGHEDTGEYCTHQLESGSYKNLQKYVNTTSHTSNRVMADQADCHEDISIHEFIAFGHLRSGGLLQWLNILRELRGRSLSFHRHEVHLLLVQTTSQVGPLENKEWAWHQEVAQPSFCFAFLEELEKLLLDVEANWLEVVTMNTISFLLRRLLASSPELAVSQKVLGLLRGARCKVFSWIQELSDKFSSAPEDEKLRGFLRDAAAICRSTFDVDLAMVPELLHTAEDIKVLLSSAIVIHHHTPADVDSLPHYSQLLLDRNRRLSLALESVISDVIQAEPNNQGIHHAVGWFWPDYRPGSKWTPLQSPNSRWLSSTTRATVDPKQKSQVVHFNLLDGLLLVDGKPLGRLPSEIQHHPLYDLLFGNQVLEVVPGDLPGMDYSTRDRISDHQVYFSLRDKDLVIQAKAGDGSETIELIPPEKLQGDLPAVLIEGHAHWLNLATSIMEIRPLDDGVGKCLLENWRIDCTPGRYRAYRGNEDLVDIRSTTWDMVSDLLKPLDAPQNLMITVSPADSNQTSSSLRLSAALPRYRLSFYVDEDEDLQSRDIRGMVYDENQSIGTLFGLVNQLVLRPKCRDVDADSIVPRCVLIPEGDISFRKEDHHVRVEINLCNSALRRVTYQAYRIDTDLGYLTGNGSLTSKLFCACLHALTSGCSTDPLTGRSGTEEALSLLQSASSWSIMKIDSRDAGLLCLIGSLCPSRTWYPAHLRNMQNVAWLDLPVNSQHSGLYLVSKAIKEHCERVQSFHEGELDPLLFNDFPNRDEHLLECSAQRAACLSPSACSEQPSRANLDVRYPSRDLMDVTSGEHRAYAAATVVYRRTPNARTNKDVVLKQLNSWTGTVSRDAALSLRYDRSWLKPNLPLIWLKAYDLLLRKDEGKWFRLLFTLPAMAYASSTHSDLVPVLVAFAVDSRFQSEKPPHYDATTYDLSKGYCPSSTTLRSYVSDCAFPFECSPESDERAKFGESLSDLRKRRSKMYKDRRSMDTDTTVQRWEDAWPCMTPPQCSLDPNLYNVAELTSNANKLFASCYRNRKLKEHLTGVQNILNSAHSQVIPPPTLRYSFDSSQCVPSCTPWSLTLGQLFTRPPPSLPAFSAQNALLPGSVRLYQLLSTTEANAVNPFQQRYASALRASADYLGAELSPGTHGLMKLPAVKALQAHYARCNANYIGALQHVQQHLRPKNESEQALEKSGQWPRITAHTLFRCLASNSPIALSDDWKACLIKLTLLALHLQRARRLLRLHLAGLHEDLRKELENEGCDGWNPEAHPDWLLIQLQENFLVRRVQAAVANEMIAPRSGSNTTMQLNMGEGKSSVIVPIVAVDLADGDQLVRVIVPKALTVQMFSLLADRLGGLVNRRIYFIPFSRSLDVDPEKATALHDIMSECMRERGILVVQPEHVLSLRLVSVEKQLPPEEHQEKDVQLGRLLLDLQKWLHSHSRDILDESDETLHVRYQLVYTIGTQKPVDGFPARWTTTQKVLSLVNKHVSSLRERFPLGVEYDHGSSGSFPRLRILHNDAGQQLIAWIAKDVIDGRLDFGFELLRSSIRDAVQSFISCEHVSPAIIRLVREYAKQTPLWGGLLLLRGLLTTGVLLFAFKDRRWRVDYGLTKHTMLAVPYRAKDVPAQRAEFGHPDVAIILTCLSYYYGGLTEDQLKLCFDILLRQDDPTLDYDIWVRNCCDIPNCLQTLKGVNIESSKQWKKHLVPWFAWNKATIDFYLSNVVFPKEAKEFPSKLSCSGWDLAEKKERLVTGFSGTNDGQYLLPLHITQCDPDHQRGTNAKVLSYLLQSENNHYMCMSHENGERGTTHEFLKIMVAEEPEIRVLLDVGAQMLDLKNYELAEVWLELNPNAHAAIYFNEDDELTVRTRDGSTQPLVASSFAQQLDQCVVYLDDAHTRGTDIKFPSGFRAGVTLGPKVTKDRLTQGCMRMRKLGHGHSIMFFAPLEVDRRIRAVAGEDKDPSEVIETTDILNWTMHETCEEIRQRAPHWAQQGMGHAARYSAWTSFCNGQLSAEALSAKWLQPEAKKLEDLYGPQDASDAALLVTPEIRERCTELGISSLRDVSVDEEQEREVAHEVECERRVERPPKAAPSRHSVHADVVSFVKTGVIPTTDIFRPVFETLDSTSAAAEEAHVWSSSVLATKDFWKTVGFSSPLDEYLRPVQWVLSGRRYGNEVLVILSPHEANDLIPHIRSSKHVHLHLYVPRVTRSMKPCDDLALYSIPPVSSSWTVSSLLVDQLNVFAGQLYLKDYETYIRLCRFMCVYAKDLQNEEGIEVGCDGFISPTSRPMGLRPTEDTFQSSPINSLKTLVSLRRKGMRFAPTHMGKLLDGRVLSEDDFKDGDHDSSDSR